MIVFMMAKTELSSGCDHLQDLTYRTAHIGSAKQIYMQNVAKFILKELANCSSRMMRGGGLLHT